MDKDPKFGILFSEPVREIMGRTPGKILRWGTAAMAIVFILFLFFAWVIRYPDIITAQVEITTENPPVILASKITGHIKNLYVTDREEVNSGQLMAVMETAVSVREFNELKQLIDTAKHPEVFNYSLLPTFSELGEIQEYWSLFLKSLNDFNNYIINDFYGNKIKSVNDEINGILTYLNRLKIKEKLYSENQALEEIKFKRDSLLFLNGVFSESDLENSRQELLKIMIELQQVRIDQSQKNIELAGKRQLLQDYRIKRLEEREKYYSVLNQSFLNLKAQIKIWENTFLLISPVSGIVSFTKYWTKNQSVGKDEPVIRIVPQEPGDFVGRLNLKMHRSGKVRPGQTVNIKLSSYPYLEYGMVRGTVKSKSLVPDGDAYIIELSLPKGLTTLYGIKLEFNQNMQGIAEVITDDIRLLQRIINPVHYLLTRNRKI